MNGTFESQPQIALEALIQLAANQNLVNNHQQIPQQSINPVQQDQNIALIAQLLQNPLLQPQTQNQQPQQQSQQILTTSVNSLNGQQQQQQFSNELLAQLFQGLQPQQQQPQNIQMPVVPASIQHQQQHQQANQLFSELSFKYISNILACSTISTEQLISREQQKRLRVEFYILQKASKNQFINHSIEYDIERYFKQFGNIVDVAIMRDKNTGKSRGFAFITFKENSYEKIQNLTQRLVHPTSHHIIQGRIIEVREGDGTKPPDSFLDKTDTIEKNSSYTNRDKSTSRQYSSKYHQSQQSSSSRMDMKRRN